MDTTKSLQEHKAFKESYQNFIKVFLYFNPEICFALVVIDYDLFVITNDINLKSSKILNEKE